jgi:hypothetical protein
MGQVSQMIIRLQGEIRALIEEATEISYFSRGAWSYETVLAASAFERSVFQEFLKKRLEAASKMTFPVF